MSISTLKPPLSESFGVLILAAGQSSRMGSPKQLLEFQGRSLLRHAALTAIVSGAVTVAVVLGHIEERLRTEIADLSVTPVSNVDWREGMSSSVRVGIRAMGENISCVVIMLCDQPLITSEHIAELALTLLQRGEDLVASRYGAILGVPCAFARSTFSDLSKLQGEHGAREFIRNKANVRSVEFSNGLIDIDTPGDYSKLNKPGFENS